MLDHDFIEALRAEAQEFQRIFDAQRDAATAANQSPFPAPQLEMEGENSLLLKYLSNAADMLRAPCSSSCGICLPVFSRSSLLFTRFLYYSPLQEDLQAQIPEAEIFAKFRRCFSTQIPKCFISVEFSLLR